MASRDEVATMVAQWLEAGGHTLPPSAVDEAVEAITDDADDDWTGEGGVLDRVLTAAVAALEAEGDRIRRDCQMRGQSEASGLRIRPNGEFIAQSGPREVRERSLRGWPTSPHWHVVIGDGDDAHTYTGTELGSWAAVAVEAEQLAGELAAAEAARLARWRRRVSREANAVRTAEHALTLAQQARDAAICEALDAGLSVTDTAAAARINRQRVYQIKSGPASAGNQ